jgi:hypothetical protein
VRVIRRHLVAVDDVNRSLFTRCDHDVRMRAWLVGKQQDATRSQVDVIVTEMLLIERSEIIEKSQIRIRGAQFQ